MRLPTSKIVSADALYYNRASGYKPNNTGEKQSKMFAEKKALIFNP